MFAWISAPRNRKRDNRPTKNPAFGRDFSRLHMARCGSLLPYLSNPCEIDYHEFAVNANVTYTTATGGGGAYFLAGVPFLIVNLIPSAT
jgi:hypothetical protein